MDSTPLAVGFSDASLSIHANTAQIQWITRSESNNPSFTVWHKEGATDWKPVATVKGAGNSVQINEYVYVVNDLKAGIHAFKVVDASGKSSKEMQILIDLPSSLTVYQAYPNPFSHQTALSFAVSAPQKVSVNLYNVLGQEVLQLFEGDVIENELQSVQIEAQKLAVGQYFVRVNGKYSVKVIPISLIR